MEFKARLSKVIFIAILLDVSLAYNIVTYTSSAVQIKEKTHPLHYKSEFYDFIQRTFRLANGNQVQCKIPIFSTVNQNFLPTLEEEFQSAQANDTVSISPDQNNKISEVVGDQILQALQNQCAEYRTSAFLWQFCYKKYLRQFDDHLTVAEAQKTKLEDIYAGFFYDLNATTNLTQSDYNQSYNTYNYYEIDNGYYNPSVKYVNKEYTINPHIPASNLSEFVNVYIKGKVVQLNGFNSTQITNDYQWNIQFATNKEIPSMYLSKSLSEIKNRTANSTLENQDIYYYSYTLHKFICKQFALAEVDFPPNVSVKHYTINFGGVNIQKNTDFISIYNGQFIQGKKLNALKQFSKDDLIIVYLYNQVFIKKIKRVWYHNLIELYEDDQGGIDLKSKDHFILSVQIFIRNQQFTIAPKGDLESQFTGYIDSYFDLKRFPKKYNLISGRYLINYPELEAKVGDTLLFISKNNYFSTRVRSIIGKGIIEIDTSLNEFNGFIMKANSDSRKQTYYDYYPQNKGIESHSNMLDSIYDNKSVTNIKKKKQYPYLLSFKSIKGEISSDSQLVPYTDLEGFSFSSEQLTQQRYFNFVIKTPLVRENFSQLKLVVTDSLEEIKEGIEIIFTHDNQILAYDVLNKKNIISKNKRYENQTLSDATIWILLDTDNTLRVGFSQIISPSNQVLELQTNYSNLRHFRFLTKHTVNFEIRYPYLDTLDRPIDFSVLNPNVTLYQGQTIKQHYFNGEQCSVINGPRTFFVEYICGQSFFSILSVTEPSTCRYKVIAETYLLCQKHQFTYNMPPPPKNIYCILKDTINNNHNSNHTSVSKII